MRIALKFEVTRICSHLPAYVTVSSCNNSDNTVKQFNLDWCCFSWTHKVVWMLCSIRPFSRLGRHVGLFAPRSLICKSIPSNGLRLSTTQYSVYLCKDEKHLLIFVQIWDKPNGRIYRYLRLLRRHIPKILLGFYNGLFDLVYGSRVLWTSLVARGALRIKNTFVYSRLDLMWGDKKTGNEIAKPSTNAYNRQAWMALKQPLDKARR